LEVRTSVRRERSSRASDIAPLKTNVAFIAQRVVKTVFNTRISFRLLSPGFIASVVAVKESKFYGY